MKRPRLLLGSLAAVVVLALAVPGAALSPSVYGAYASALQALLIFLALLVAAWAGQSEWKARRVERVLSLHELMTSGEIGAARRRLGDQLRHGQPRDGNGWIREVSTEDLQHGSVSTYGPSRLGGRVPGPTPLEDRNVILRYFERVQIAQELDALDDASLAALIGKHAGWWDLALADEDKANRRPLRKLAQWTEDFALSHSDHPVFVKWGVGRNSDFGACGRSRGKEQ